MWRHHHTLRLLLPLPLLLVAAAARGEIFLHVPGIQGDNRSMDCQRCIAIQTVQIAGQTITASSPWFVTPPPGTASVTLTKLKDGASGGLSAAFASKQVMPFADITLLTRDARGSVSRSQSYKMHDVTVSAFTSTGTSETFTLSFKKMDGVVPPTPTRATERRAAPSENRKR